MEAATYFVSDTHCSPHHPERNQAVIDCLQDVGTHADALYLLGDIFDDWLGDDDPSDWWHPLAETMQALSHRMNVYVMPGNHDPFLGQAFCTRYGLHWLPPEPQTIDLYGHPTIVLHGDSLCTRDVGYQRWRRILFHPWTARCVHTLPFSTRRRLVTLAHGINRQQRPQKPLEVIAPQEEAVAQVFTQHPLAQRMVHGHTHQPGCYPVPNAPEKQRWVLGGWKTGETRTIGWVLASNPTTFHLQDLA